jgi:hypothetical protein
LTGLSTQSDESPGAWLVLEPSKPQMGHSLGISATTLVLERRRAVGSVPSIQMYSALIATGDLLHFREVDCDGGTLPGGDCPAVSRL